MWSFKYIVSFLYFLSAFLSLCESKSDLIERLPGLHPNPKFRQYSGYLNATEGTHLFYWFIESQKNPSKDPVVLWLNGGPGVSSLMGLFTENGPFRVLPNGRTVTYDKYSWNSLANVLYIESPAGVGFSYSEKNDYRTSDDETLKFNYEALNDFFKKYPQFLKNEFYLTGESYAAVYLSLLALKILNNQSSKINLKGLAIGNGVFDQLILSQSRPFYAQYHGLIDTQTFNELKSECCSYQGNDMECAFPVVNSNYTLMPVSTNPNCTLQFGKTLQSLLATGIDFYNIYDFCPKFDSSHKISKDETQSHKFFTNMTMDSLELNNEEINDKKTTNYFEDVEQTHECVSKGYYQYLNNHRVLKELHISTNSMAWNESNTFILQTYVQNYDNMSEQFIEINRANLKTIVYNGDFDLICDCVGDQIFLDSLNIPIVKESTNWLYDGITAGFVKSFANNLTFFTIRGAGHMVPKDKPKPCLKLLKVLLGKDIFN
jgi:cathepsin A (carboxypeptidase C)